MAEKLTLKTAVGHEEKDPNYQQLVNTNNGFSDKITEEVVTEVLNPEKRKTMSRIKFEQTPNLVKLHLFSDIYEDEFTRDIAEYILDLQISTNGLGRKELLQVAQQRTEIIDMNQINKGNTDIFK